MPDKKPDLPEEVEIHKPARPQPLDAPPPGPPPPSPPPPSPPEVPGG